MSEIRANTATSPYNRKNPFLSEMIQRRSLTRPGSGKDTRHCVFSLAGSGLVYMPGDSLAVFGQNPPALVDEVLSVLHFPADAIVQDGRGHGLPLRQVLTESFILNRATRKIMTGLGERVPQGEQRNRLMEIVDNDEMLGAYVHSRDFVDVLTEFDEVKFESPEAFLAQLSPVPPRLYSIASSLAGHPDEAHLCVGVVRYETHGRLKTGLCSGFLADHAPLHRNSIPIYVQESRHFRLPSDGTRDIIMVGPGTGLAPFRAFLEQRRLDGATGRNWLFFGEQHRATDFLYEDDLTAFHRSGDLHRLDLAFSRDQPQKIYVQHRMKENAQELWNWLQGGAYFYVCGDAHRMAKDVHQALIEIVQAQAGGTPEAAAEFVNVTLMKTERRYLRDVY